jgi:putative ATP-binding cassette transporter
VLLQSSLLLGSFIGVLWILSRNVAFDLSGRNFAIPGYMVWCALVYAGTASWLSWRVGRPLIQLNADRYAREAELRYALVRLSEHIDGVALCGGEEDEKLRLATELEEVLRITRRIVGAFMQVQQALRWFIDNFSNIADWRATLLRIASFRETMVTMDRLGAAENRIEFIEPAGDKFTFENLEIATPTGCTTLSERHVELALGDRVLIVGEPGTGKTILFRAIAGLWPWGSDSIALPSSNGVMFMPRQPYVPLGTLRAALTYPSPETAYQDQELGTVLQCAGLSRLSSSLDRTARWDKELTDDEQQWLVLARISLHKPRWVVIDQVLDALDDDACTRVISLFSDSLKDAAVIHIGRPETKKHFFTRVLHLIKDPYGRCFRPDRTVPSAGQAMGAPSMEWSLSAAGSKVP